MFCTVCAAVNPRLIHRCAVCGAPLLPPVAARRACRRRARSRRWLGRIRALLVVILPLAALVAGGGYWQADQAARAAAYARGIDALAGGNYLTAADAFAAAGDYRDAERRQAQIEALLAAYQTDYVDALAALAIGDYRTAITLLIPIVRDLADYRDAAMLLADARYRWEQELYQTIEVAEERQDWLTVEAALAELAAANPDDPALQTRLAAVRHDRAPLVYSRARAIYLIGPDGSHERLILDTLPAVWPVWSPDRRQIAFVSTDRSNDGDQATLYVLPIDGGEPRRLAQGLRPNAPPVWSPDGQWIAYASQATQQEGAEVRRWTVRIVEVATGREIDLTGGRLPNAASPSWSPDGQRLAVVSRRDEGLHAPGMLPSAEVYLVSLATGQITNVGQGRITDPWRLAWSPAAEAIVIATRRPGMSYDADRSPLYLLDVRSGALTDLNPRVAKVSMAVWSPEGQRFAYVENGTTVRVRGLDGTDAWTTLDAPVAGALTWSPGGDALLAIGLPGQPSLLIPLGEEFGQECPVTLLLDLDTRQAGTPQWSPVNPAPPPVVATTAGTAHDPATSDRTLRRSDAVVDRQTGAR